MLLGSLTLLPLPDGAVFGPSLLLEPIAGSVSTHPIPEPGAATAFAVGLTILLVAARRRGDSRR